MVIIGISLRFIDMSYKVNANLIEKIKESGAIPLLILPNFIDFFFFFLSKCQGFIIPGGNTWDKVDELIIKYAIKHNLPLLGICAGMQAVANIHNFAKDIPSDQTIPIGNNKHHNSNKYVHRIQVVDDFLESIIQSKTINVNSRHKFTITKEDYFVVDAYSEDGLIEAIHLPNKKFILGVQWHPEDLTDEFSVRIFRAFIEACQNP